MYLPKTGLLRNDLTSFVYLSLSGLFSIGPSGYALAYYAPYILTCKCGHTHELVLTLKFTALWARLWCRLWATKPTKKNQKRMLCHKNNKLK